MIVQNMKWMEELVQSLHKVGDLVLVLAIIIPPLREDKRKQFRERKERDNLWTLDEQI